MGMAVTADDRQARARARVVLFTSATLLALMHYAIFLTGELEAMTDAVLELVAVDPAYRMLALKLVWAAGTVVFYLVLPGLVVRLVLRERLADHGLTLRGFGRHLPIYLLLFVPVGILVLVVAGQPDFLETYPLYRAPVGVVDLVVWELAYGVQFLALEFFFRGFMLHGTRAALGASAIWVMMVPYVMIHFGKPLYETLGAVVAGLVLGHLSLATRSVAGGAFLHWGVAIAMDLAALARRPTPFPGT
ncbi:MAG: CPBP family intramembrane metalloprotease [Deltaproteobacteria bacterium]|nr:CPBP family intramembrane metalloprotease [Deltaproteobacteria bacterium]